MTFTVYHANVERFINEGIRAFAALSSERVTMMFATGYYQKVATVECDEIGRVFQLTNSIYNGWWENAEIVQTFFTEAGCRSTSVGDVIVTATGERYQVGNAGLFEF